MRTALFIDADHQLDQTGILAPLADLVLLSRAVCEMATASMTQDEQRRVRAIQPRLTLAIADAKDAQETDHVCLERRV